MANPPIVIGPFGNVPAPGSPIRSDWAQQITRYVLDSAQRFATIADLKAQSAGVTNGTIAVITGDARWGPIVKTSAGWVGTRNDFYSGTTDSVGRVTLTLASFGFATVYSAVPSGSISFGTDIANLLPFVRVAANNFEFYFLKVTNAGTVAYDNNKAVQFTVAINGVLTP